MAVKLFSNYHNGWRPNSGATVYTEPHGDKRVVPLGVIHEPDYADAAGYGHGLLSFAAQQIPAWLDEGVEHFAFNTEKCWRGRGSGSTQASVNAIAAAMRSVRVGVKGGEGLGGAYGCFKDDADACVEPEKDQLGFNSICGRALAGVVTYVEVSVYPLLSEDGNGGAIETLNGSTVTPVLRRAWHQIQQARLLCPGVGVRLWLSDQSHPNGVKKAKLKFVPAGEFAKTVKAAVKLPGVTAAVHWSGYNQLVKDGAGIPLTEGMRASRKAFVDSASAA